MKHTVNVKTFYILQMCCISLKCSIEGAFYVHSIRNHSREVRYSALMDS